jgi:hypothetical protein
MKSLIFKRHASIILCILAIAVTGLRRFVVLNETWQSEQSLPYDLESESRLPFLSENVSIENDSINYSSIVYSLNAVSLDPLIGGSFNFSRFNGQHHHFCCKRIQRWFSRDLRPIWNDETPDSFFGYPCKRSAAILDFAPNVKRGFFSTRNCAFRSRLSGRFFDIYQYPSALPKNSCLGASFSCVRAFLNCTSLNVKNYQTQNSAYYTQNGSPQVPAIQCICAYPIGFSLVGFCFWCFFGRNGKGLRGHLKSGHAWSGQNRPCTKAVLDRLFLLCRRLRKQVCFCAPASRTALEYVSVVKQSVEHGSDGRTVSQQLAPVFHGAVGG